MYIIIIIYYECSMHVSTTLAWEGANADINTTEINVLLTMFLLLYADTVICSETPGELQKGLNIMKSYCDKWQLKLNVKKCKMIVFSRGKVRKLLVFTVGNNKLDVVSSFQYLGIITLNYNCSF